MTEFDLILERLSYQSICDCSPDVHFGNYRNVLLVRYPFKGTAISVDKCLADELTSLWKVGIRTTCSCCGHNLTAAAISVADECIPDMEKLGYIHQLNTCDLVNAKRRDSFYSKSIKTCCTYCHEEYDKSHASSCGLGKLKEAVIDHASLKADTLAVLEKVPTEMSDAQGFWCMVCKQYLGTHIKLLDHTKHAPDCALAALKKRCKK